ncbi:MAG TPA: response regulator transcription factor, partial [Chloroflexota bacterium]|nr:response regulator transcription factor [Chloroflexota bacterium]
MDAGARADGRGPQAGAVVLVVEPDAAEFERIEAALTRRGIGVCRAETGAQAKEMAHELRPDLIVLELELPDADGLVLCADLRPRGAAPVVVYTQRGARERVLSLRLGADDAVAKATDVDEVVARIEVALRRARMAPAHRTAGEEADGAGRGGTPFVSPSASPMEAERFQRMGDLEIDRLLGKVVVAGQALYLSATEYRLLSLFLSRPGEVMSREELSEQLFGLRHVQG